MQNVVNHMAATIRKDGAFYLPAEGARVAQIDVRDIAAVAVPALTACGHEGRAYELTGPESLSFDDVAVALSKALGREVRYVPVSPQDYKKGALAAGVPESYADALLDLYRFFREGGGSPVTSTVRDITGRDATRFEQFARDHAALVHLP